jgi:hypothetical protein
MVTHKWSYCDLCECHITLCGTCGNNVCNGGAGEVDGEPCPDCESSYQEWIANPEKVQANKPASTPDIAGLCKKLRAALKGVTPGPWDDTRGRSGLRIIEGDSGCPVASYVSEKDAAFIALSREAAPVLLDTLERQADEIERLRGGLNGAKHELKLVIRDIDAALTGEDT